jgi:cardiolipin synthase
MHSTIADLWPVLVLIADITAATAVTMDAVLRKRHVPSIVGWIGLAWLAPLVGSFLYLCFGINRIKTSAITHELEAAWARDAKPGTLSNEASSPEHITAPHPFASLARLGREVTGDPLVSGNQVTLLKNGDEAYPAMLDAIGRANQSVALLVYILDNDSVGQLFLDALLLAIKRGAHVRVLIDDFGARYTRPSMISRLRDSGIPVAGFLPTRTARLIRYANLRNHRKILVVDGAIGFTGGMNIREAHWLARSVRDSVHCAHFRIEGPIVADMQRTFAVDWAFTTGEHLKGARWFPALDRRSTVVARGVKDGPDADLDNMLRIILGALSVATQTVRIVTPYFLPNDALLRAVQVTALRGIDVAIVLPFKSNIPIMDWAMAPQLPDLLTAGCRIYFTPGMFDHTKLFVVDSFWSLIGSTNWDARSLRLNFEYNLECYDASLAQNLENLIEGKIARAYRLRLCDTQSTGFPVRLRNGLARLLSPFL